MDETNLLEALIDVFQRSGIHYCVIGGQAVNAYAEPLVSQDLDLAVAAEQVEPLAAELARLKLSAPGSKLRVRIQTDSRYTAFVERASVRDVLGLPLPVARAADVLDGKVWAALDPGRRPSKRRKDLLDIERLVEAQPHLRERVPEEIARQLWP